MKKIIFSIFLMMFAVLSFAAIKQVESKYVCMVTNGLFDRVQIPVEVNNKTYYGCCGGCKKRLTNDTAIRYSIDPVSGNKVDKATATIGASTSGKIYYFENLENLNEFER